MKCIRTEKDALEIDGKTYDKLVYELNVKTEGAQPIEIEEL
jgi:hypothetical protein